MLDPPGHVDFSSEMERTLQVLDYAILVISGTDGVQGHTLTLWRLLSRYHIPTFLFINKMDLAGADRDALLEQLRLRLSAGCVDFSAPEDAWQEDAAVCDEGILEKYLETGTLEDADVISQAQDLLRIIVDGSPDGLFEALRGDATQYQAVVKFYFETVNPGEA